MSTPPINFFTILSESKRLIKAHSYHFLALSALFLLPISFSIILYPVLHRQILHLAQQTRVLILILHMTFVFVLSLCAAASITYSVFKAFYGKPVKFTSAIKSIISSFVPLFITTIICQIILSVVLVVFAILVFLVLKSVKLVGFQLEYSSQYFMCFALVILIALFFVLVYLQVKWGLVPVVVVMESSWGLKPLKKSASLIKEYRWVALSSCLYFSSLSVILCWSSSLLISMLIGTGDDEWSLALTLIILMNSFLLTSVSLSNLAANTLLYIYCKAKHGELIAEEFQFGNEYISLLFDDGKVPHLVPIAGV